MTARRFDDDDADRNGSPYFIGLPDGRILKVAWWDHDNNPFQNYDTPPQPTRIFNMDMPIPEGAKVFPATEVTRGGDKPQPDRACPVVKPPNRINYFSNLV